MSDQDCDHRSGGSLTFSVPLEPGHDRPVTVPTVCPACGTALGTMTVTPQPAVVTEILYAAPTRQQRFHRLRLWWSEGLAVTPPSAGRDR